MKLALILATFATSVPVFTLADQTRPAVQPSGEAAQHTQSDRKIEPDAKQLLDRSAEATSRIRDITMRVERQSMRQPDGSDIVPIISMTDAEAEAADRELVIQPSEHAIISVTIPEQHSGMPITYYKISKTDSEWNPTEEWSFDGSTLYKLDHNDKKLWTIARTPEDWPPYEILARIPHWLFDAMYIEQGQTLVSARLAGESQIDGVDCIIVEEVRELEFPSMKMFEDDDAHDDNNENSMPDQMAMKIAFTFVRHLGAEDYLPRRIDSTVQQVGMPEMDNTGFQDNGAYSNLRVNRGLRQSDFTLELPAGYEKVEGTLADFGLPEDAPNRSLDFAVGDKAPNFSLSDADGNVYTMDTLAGRVILLDFWATWCGPCIAVMPKIQALHEKFADKPVSILGVNTWEDNPTAGTNFMKRRNYTYTNLLNGDELAQTYGVFGIPTLILIGGDGKVLYTAVGAGPDAEKTLSDLIEGELTRMSK